LLFDEWHTETQLMDMRHFIPTPPDITTQLMDIPQVAITTITLTALFLVMRLIKVS
jgi:hypothetical protein